MKAKGKKTLVYGVGFILAFILWTILIQTIDVKSIGINDTKVGFATINSLFHSLTGVNMTLYIITDWLGLVPVFICMVFGFIGLIQWIKRRNILKVDLDIIFLGIYYVIVVLCYLIFEMIPINYRPIFINGFMEASYPSSTTLLILAVMPTLVFQTCRRLKSDTFKRVINFITILFSIFMVLGRLISGVHWLTDIIGSILISCGLFYIYKGTVILSDRENFGGCLWNLAKNFRN